MSVLQSRGLTLIGENTRHTCAQDAEPRLLFARSPSCRPTVQIFRAIGRLRMEARDEIDRLIRFLDETDNHVELEPEDEGTTPTRSHP